MIPQNQQQLKQMIVQNIRIVQASRAITFEHASQLVCHQIIQLLPTIVEEADPSLRQE
jgi:hypothetical protein